MICQTVEPVETTTILNAPWDEHSMMFVLGKTKYQYQPLRATRNSVILLTRQQNEMKKHVLLPYDLDLWPTTPA